MMRWLLQAFLLLCALIGGHALGTRLALADDPAGVCGGVRAGWERAVASGKSGQITAAREAARRMSKPCPELQRKIAAYYAELKRKEERRREELESQQETDRLVAAKRRVAEAERAARLRCDSLWQTAKNDQTLDGFEGFVKSCASHGESGTARGRIEAIYANPLDGIVGLPAPGTPIPREGLSEENKARANKCDGGDAIACTNLGYYFGRGEGAPKDQLWKAALTARACAANNPYACGNLGADLNNGSGVKQDLSRSAVLKERGCELGAKFSCTNWGHSYEDGAGVERDPSKALALYERGCDQGKQGGDASGCLYAARRYESGLFSLLIGDPKKIALRLAEAGLRLDPKDERLLQLQSRNRPSINMIGFSTLADGTPVGSIPSLSPEIQNLASECIKAGVLKKFTSACWSVGVAYETGKGAPLSLEDALVFFERACAVGNTSVCYDFARVYQLARGETADFGTAFNYLEKACNTGVAEACANAAELLIKGAWGVSFDRTKAVDLVKRGLVRSFFPTVPVSDKALATRRRLEAMEKDLQSLSVTQ